MTDTVRVTIELNEAEKIRAVRWENPGTIVDQYADFGAWQKWFDSLLSAQYGDWSVERDEFSDISTPLQGLFYGLCCERFDDKKRIAELEAELAEAKKERR